MKVDNIIIGKQVSKNLYHFGQNIEPEDLLKVIRFLSSNGRDHSYMYESNKIFYTKSDSITRQEFDYVYKHVDKNIDYLLDRFTREDLVNRVGSAIKIISSTTKTEIVQKIAENKDLLFRFFKKDFIEKYCSKWYEFKKQKIFLRAVSDKRKCLVLAMGYKSASLSGKKYLQFWCLGNKHNHVEIDRNFKTAIIRDGLIMNLKDSDETIIQNIYKFLEKKDKGKEFGLCCEYREITNKDLNIEKADAITYPLDIDTLAACFGSRKGSKFLTFSEGLRKRKEPELIEKYQGRKFLIAADSHDIYCGLAHDKEFFEKIAWFLKIEYMDDKRIICKITGEETQEAITALWEMIGEKQHTGQFHFIEL